MPDHTNSSCTMNMKRPLIAIAVFVFLFSSGLLHREAVAQEAAAPAQETTAPAQEALAAMEKATKAMRIAVKVESTGIDAWGFVSRYQKEGAALQERITEWQDNTQDGRERVIEAEKLIEDWRKKVEELQELTTEDADLPDNLYPLVTRLWKEAAEELEEAANALETAMQTGETAKEEVN